MKEIGFNCKLQLGLFFIEIAFRPMKPSYSLYCVYLHAFNMHFSILLSLFSCSFGRNGSTIGPMRYGMNLNKKFKISIRILRSIHQSDEFSVTVSLFNLNNHSLLSRYLVFYIFHSQTKLSTFHVACAFQIVKFRTTIKCWRCKIVQNVINNN